MVKKFSQAHFGQALDIYWSRNMTYANLTNWMNDSIGPKILQMYAYKTAAVVEGLAELACIIAKVDKSIFEVCTTFGRSFGVAFQIIDDLLDITGDEATTGKSLGTDLLKQKTTLPLIRLLATVQPSQREAILAV